MKTFTTAVIILFYVNYAFASALTDAANGGVGEDIRKIYGEAISNCSDSHNDPEACLRLLSSIPVNYEDVEYYLGFGHHKKAAFASRKQLPLIEVIRPLDNSYQAYSNYAATNKRFATDSKKRAGEVGNNLLSVLRKDLTEKIEFVDRYIDSQKNQSAEPENVFSNSRTALNQAETEMERFSVLRDELSRLYHRQVSPADSSLGTLFDNMKKKYKKVIIDSGYEDKMSEALSMNREISTKLKNRQPDSNVTNRYGNPDRAQYNNCKNEAKKECNAQSGYGSAEYSACYYRAENLCATWYRIR